MDSYDKRAPENDVEYEEIFNAASEGSIRRLEAALLPSMGVDALEADPLQGRAALHIAAQAGSVPAIQWLLAHGATVDLRNSEGETPLHEAAFWAHPEAIKALLAAGADVNLPTGDYNYTALLNVLKYKHTVTPRQIETIELLLSHPFFKPPRHRISMHAFNSDESEPVMIVREAFKFVEQVQSLFLLRETVDAFSKSFADQVIEVDDFGSKCLCCSVMAAERLGYAAFPRF